MVSPPPATRHVPLATPPRSPFGRDPSPARARPEATGPIMSEPKRYSRTKPPFIRRLARVEGFPQGAHGFPQGAPPLNWPSRENT